VTFFLFFLILTAWYLDRGVKNIHIHYPGSGIDTRV